MQKKLIALAIATAMTVPALAFAEVNISGQANMSLNNVNDGAATNSASAWQLRSNQSRVVLKGSDDLGDGLSAMWQLDSRFNIDDGQAANGRLFDGNSFVGVKSNDLGSVMVGRIDSSLKTASRKLDIFFDVAGDFRSGSLGGVLGDGHDVRINNALAYVSPNMGGVAVSAATTFGGENPVANSSKGQLLSLAGTYTMDNIYAMLAYQSIKAGDANTGELGAGTGAIATSFNLANKDDEAKIFRLGGSYAMDAFTVNAMIEMPNVKILGIETKHTDLYIAGKFAVNSNDNVGLAYSKRGETDVAGVKQNNDASQIAVGYDHSMSKATSVYAHYTKTSANGTAADPSNLELGIKHAF